MQEEQTETLSLVTAAERHRIVIVGGGAGGLELATRLGNTLGRQDKAEIILIDCNPHTFGNPCFMK